MIIAVDGPSASGKSTTAKSIAETLGFLYIDTGAMYRGVALLVIKNAIDFTDLSSLASMLSKIHMEFRQIDKIYRLFVNGEDVSDQIRTPQVTKMSSDIATIKIVREKMVELQRQFSQNHDVVLDGRDIGTVVFPNADVKIYLTASIDERARRRYAEMRGQVESGRLKDVGTDSVRPEGVTLVGTSSVEMSPDIDFEKIKADLIARDKTDSERKESPLKKADDAIEVDTTMMTIEEQVNTIINIVKS